MKSHRFSVEICKIESMIVLTEMGKIQHEPTWIGTTCFISDRLNLTFLKLHSKSTQFGLPKNSFQITYYSSKTKIETIKLTFSYFVAAHPVLKVTIFVQTLTSSFLCTMQEYNLKKSTVVSIIGLSSLFILNLMVI